MFIIIGECDVHQFRVHRKTSMIFKTLRYVGAAKSGYKIRDNAFAHDLIMLLFFDLKD